MWRSRTSPLNCMRGFFRLGRVNRCLIPSLHISLSSGCSQHKVPPDLSSWQHYGLAKVSSWQGLPYSCRLDQWDTRTHMTLHTLNAASCPSLDSVILCTGPLRIWDPEERIQFGLKEAAEDQGKERNLHFHIYRIPLWLGRLFTLVLGTSKPRFAQPCWSLRQTEVVSCSR